MALEIAAFALLAALPKVTPADAPRVLAEVRRPGASVVLVNVWATWCQPCREEMPDVVRVGKEYRDRGLRLVLVSADFPEAVGDAARFLADRGVDFPSFIKADVPDQQFIDGLDPQWSGALPATFVFDGAGRLTAFWEGKADYAKLEKHVKEALEK